MMGVSLLYLQHQTLPVAVSGVGTRRVHPQGDTVDQDHRHGHPLKPTEAQSCGGTKSG